MSQAVEFAEASVETLRRRAVLTRVFLWGHVALFAGLIVLRSAAEGSDDAAELLSTIRTISQVRLLLGIFSGVGFLFWIHRLVLLTRQLDAPVSWHPAQAVWGFFVPFVNLVRPYRVLRDVQDALLVNELPEPAAQPMRSAEVGYREMRFVSAPAGRPVSRALLGWWWGLYIAMSLFGEGMAGDRSPATVASLNSYNLVAAGIGLVAALLALRVISSLTGRIAERCRRIRYSSPEALAALDVRIRP